MTVRLLVASVVVLIGGTVLAVGIGTSNVTYILCGIALAALAFKIQGDGNEME